MLRPIENPAFDRDRGLNRRGPSPLYLDFDDVLIPGELSINRTQSYVFKTENRSMGMLFLMGRNKPEVFIDFFKTNMIKDNWQATGGFDGFRSLLLFEKENRQCVITLTHEPYGVGTQVEIWVAPKEKSVGSGLLK